MQITPGYRFKSSKRRLPTSEIVYHESVSPTHARTVSDLTRKGLGVHYIIDYDGSITSHVPEDRYTYHANLPGKPWTHNQRSIGIEYVNRYYGSYAEGGDVVASFPWAHRGLYIVPPLVQLEAGFQLTAEVAARNQIPMRFPANPEGKFLWNRWQHHDNKPLGIMAHHRWANADGLFPECYSLLRTLGVKPEKAMEAALQMAGASTKTRRLTTIPVDTCEA